MITPETPAPHPLEAALLALGGPLLLVAIAAAAARVRFQPTAADRGRPAASQGA